MKIESNKNWTTCLRLNTGDGSPRVFLLNSHFLGSVPLYGSMRFFIHKKEPSTWLGSIHFKIIEKLRLL